MRVLAQNGRRSEGLTPRTLPLCRGVGIDLLDQPRDQPAIRLRAEMTPAGELGELDRAGQYQFEVINDTIDHAVEQISQILSNQGIVS